MWWLFFCLAFCKDYFRARVNKQQGRTKNTFIQKKHIYENKNWFWDLNSSNQKNSSKLKPI